MTQTVKFLLVFSVIIAMFAIGGAILLGLRFQLGRDTSNMRTNEGIGVPLGTVRLIDRSSNVARAAVELHLYNEIYRALGVSNEKLVRWEKAYGYGSEGVSPDGTLFIQGFPVFSKVAWMYVEPVDLSPEEAQQLIRECTSAMNLTSDVGVNKELFEVRRLAEDSIRDSMVVRFDQP